MIRKVLASTLVVTIVWTSSWATAPGWALGAPEDSGISDAERSNLERFKEKAQSLREKIDRSQFDLETILDRLDYDTARIIKFASEEISYERYPGLLRGAAGTLMSRAGNDLDQAILLATLLNDAGAEARIVAGSLAKGTPDPLAARQPDSPPFVERTFLSTEEELSETVEGLLGPDPSQDIQVERLLGKSALESQEKMSSLLREINHTSSILLSRVEASGIVALNSGSNELASLGSEEYFWVEYREGPTSPWSEIHPVFAGLPKPTTSRDTVISAEIPAQLQHRVRIELWLEREWGSEVESLPLFPAWERPAANLHAKSVTVSLIPGGLGQSDTLRTPVEVLEASNWWIPVIDGKTPEDASVFNLDGLVGPLESLTPTGEFIATVSGKMGKGLQALGGIGDSQPSVKATTAIRKIAVRYSLIGPGGSARKHERVLFQRQGDQLAVNGTTVGLDSWRHELAAGLSQSHIVGFNCGRVPRSLIIDQTLGEFEQGMDAFMTYMPEDTNTNSQIDSKLADNLPPLAKSSLLRALHVSDLGPSTLGIERAYRPAPMILVVKQGLGGTAEGGIQAFEQVDVVSSPWVAISQEGEALRADPRDVLRLGVWNTATEGAALTRRESAHTSGSAFSGLNASQVPADGWTVLSEGDSKRIRSSGLDWAHQQPLLDELDQGRIIAIPSGMLASSHHGPAPWWSIDPRTGETVGMAVGPGGAGGSEFVKYLTMMLIFVATGLLYYSYYDCWSQYSGIELWCCLFDSWFTAMLGALVAVVIAELLLMAATEMGATAIITGPLSGSEWSAVVAALLTDFPAGATGLAGLRIPVCATATS